ncbi:papain-like cysteine protease family protein [Lentisphaerota bacterium ZTH]|nr:hypothetical protein JYG24_09015 [Lentisphaerota bacterium]WET06367.1 papain-like cysteine protease family protein [Lentisphaerota bacterium ZTH]
MRLRKGIKIIADQKNWVLDSKYNKDYHNEKNEDINFEVPFVFQGHVNLCYDACLYMMKLFVERNKYRHNLESDLIRIPSQLKSYRIRNNPRGILEGLNTDIAPARGKELGLELMGGNMPKRNFRNKVYFNLTMHGPFMMFYPVHGVLIKGIVGDKIITHDSWHGGNLVWTEEVFRSKIADYEYMINFRANLDRNEPQVLEQSEVHKFKCAVLDAVDNYVINYKTTGARGLIHYHGKSGCSRMMLFAINIKNQKKASGILLEIEKFINKTGYYKEFHGRIKTQKSSGLTYIMHGIMTFFANNPNPKNHTLKKLRNLLRSSISGIFEMDYWHQPTRAAIARKLAIYHMWA